MTDGTSKDDALLEVAGVSKTFPGTLALDDVSMSVMAGEIVALVGQNGSGKSTLIKILAGVYRPDPGAAIHLAGAEAGSGPGDEACELHFIHQDLGLIPLLSTVENLDLGRRRTGADGFLPVRGAQERRHAQALIREFGGDFDVTVPVAQLGAAERAIVAIARALDGWTHSRNILVLDEPTAALHRGEVRKLFDAVRSVARRGAGVIFVSHRLDEVLALADRVVALREGRVVADERRAEVDQERLIRLIAGRAIAERDGRDQGASEGETVLTVSNLRGARVHGVDLAVRSGEIVGISGILGSGREEVAGLIFGAVSRADGEVQIDGTPIIGDGPRAAIERRVAYLPADRHAAGGVMTMSVRENLTLARLLSLRTATQPLKPAAERREVRSWISRLRVVPPDSERQLGLLSGGNQQKVLFAKWLCSDPRVLLFDEPTNGVDIGAKQEIYDVIEAAAADGAAVVLASSDTKELVMMCDRVLVMVDGKVAADVRQGDLSEGRLISESLSSVHEAGVGGDADA